MEVEEQDEPANERSVVLETILGGSEGAVETFFSQVWQQSCAVYRHDDESTTWQSTKASHDHEQPLTWNGLAENPLTALIAQGWPILLHLLDGARPAPLPRGVDRPPVTEHVHEQQEQQQRAILFRHLQVLTADERAMYQDNWYAAFLNGCSVVLNHADTVSPWIAAVCDDLQRVFLHAYANTYLTPAAAQTAPPHADDRDVLVVQVYGAKQWTVYQRVPTAYPYPHEQVGKDGLAVPEAVLQGPTLIETVLRPGDVLYMPRGYVHQAVALPSEPSFHVTVALATHDWTTAGILAHELIPQLLLSQLPLRRAVPRSIGRPNTTTNHVPTQLDLQALQSTLDQALEGLPQQLTAQTVHQHLQSKVQVHNERAALARRTLYQTSSATRPPSSPAVVGYAAALHIQLTTRLRAATATERDACRRTAAKNAVGLHVREDVADAVTKIIAHVKQHPTRVGDWSQCLDTNHVPPTLCPLTLIALAKQCVELGAFAIDTSD